MPADNQGWSRAAWDQLVKRVDALEVTLANLIGVKPTDADLANPKSFRLGVKDWIAIGATIVVPILTTILVIASQR
jgi:hypothetical protein